MVTSKPDKLFRGDLQPHIDKINPYFVHIDALLRLLFTTKLWNELNTNRTAARKLVALLCHNLDSAQIVNLLKKMEFLGCTLWNCNYIFV